MVAPRESDWMGFEAGDVAEAAQACQIHHAGLCATYLDPDWHLHVGVVEIEDHGRWFARSFREDGRDPDGKPLRRMRRGGAFRAPPPKERAPLATVAHAIDWPHDPSYLLARWVGEETWQQAKQREAHHDQ